MARRRLILPALVRGPVRLPREVAPQLRSTATTRGRKLSLALLWLTLCVGLYLIGNLRRGNAVAHTSDPPLATVAVQQASVSAATVATTTTAAVPSTSAHSATAVHRMKPVRDESNLAVFGTGLERGPELGGETTDSADNSDLEPAQNRRSQANSARSQDQD